MSVEAKNSTVKGSTGFDVVYSVTIIGSTKIEPIIGKEMVYQCKSIPVFNVELMNKSDW